MFKWQGLVALGFLLNSSLVALASRQSPFNLSSIMPSKSSNIFNFKQADNIFSPNDLVSLPRPGAAVANIAGDYFFVPLSQFDTKQNKNIKYIYVYSFGAVDKPLKIELTKGGDIFWLSSHTLAYVIPSDGDEATESLSLYAWDVTRFPHHSGDSIPADDVPSTLIGKIPTTEASNFEFWPKSLHLVFSAPVWEDGKLEEVVKHDKEWEDRGNSAFVYDHTYERQWDTWKIPGKKSALFSVQLYQDPGRVWRLNANGRGFVNLQKSPETGHSTPVEPFGGTDNFAVSQNYVVYTTLDPALNKEAAWHTRQNIYIADIKGEGYPRQLTEGSQGATSSPVITLQEDKVAWLEMAEDGYEADRNKIIIYDLTKDIRYTLTPTWDRSPDALSWDKQGHILYFTAGDQARVKVFAIAIPPTPRSSSESLPLKYLQPIALTQEGAASGLQALFTGRLLFTRSTLTSPNDVWYITGLPHLTQYILDQPEDKHLPSSLDVIALQNYGSTPDTEDIFKVEKLTDFTAKTLRGKKLNPGEDFFFDGAEGKKIQGFVVKPPGFKEGEKKKWPAVLLIHGGPQGAWEDQWSTRWNPEVFAGQGYFTVFINPTGSTTFGQELTDAIAGDWGGKPFVDMKNGWKYVLENYPEIDPERAVAAGASWGGYAINWIQSNPEFGFNFKALVCHDGVFDARYNGFSTDELFFFNHEWHGRPWDAKAKATLEKFNPVNFVHKWSTPQLTIHSSKDFRLPDTEGIGAFHALQQRGVESRLLIFPDENHWVLKHGNSLKWHYEVFRWFDQFVGESAQ